ncbi:Plasma kallikrein [Bulinus truncatus]|nr:Plasma kallikrein [Bulinus truncatus]
MAETAMTIADICCGNRDLLSHKKLRRTASRIFYTITTSVDKRWADVTTSQGDNCRVLSATCQSTCSVFKTISLGSLCPDNLICCRNQSSGKDGNTPLDGSSSAAKDKPEANNFLFRGMEIPDFSKELENYLTYSAPVPTTKRSNLLDFFQMYREKLKTKLDQIDSSLNTRTNWPNYKRCGLSVNKRVKRVVGGAQAGRCEYPWMVYISRDPGKDDLCGGALVSDRHVITAAHCFDFLESRWPSVTIGEYIKGEQRTKSKFVTSNYTVVFHPNYDSFTYSHDIALLTLYQPIDLDKFECLNPICLPRSDQRLSLGDSCQVAGWGSTSKTAELPAVSTPQLMKTSVQLVNGSYCHDKFGNLFNAKIHICAGDLTGNTDSCLGDSGGPFMCRHDVVTPGDGSSGQTQRSDLYLMGVISAGGTPCAQKDTPALYTDVTKVLDWLHAEMADSIPVM